MMQEVKLLSERQDVLMGMVEDKIRLQSRATEKYYEVLNQTANDHNIRRAAGQS